MPFGVLCVCFLHVLCVYVLHVSFAYLLHVLCVVFGLRHVFMRARLASLVFARFARLARFARHCSLRSLRALRARGTPCEPKIPVLCFCSLTSEPRSYGSFLCAGSRQMMISHHLLRETAVYELFGRQSPKQKRSTSQPIV